MALELRYGLVILVVGVEDWFEGLVGRMEWVKGDVVKPPGEQVIGVGHVQLWSE
jgi:hypothetical protein